MEKIIELLKESLPKVHGWCSIEKATHLVEFILEHKPEVCVEIGVFGGSSLIPQALALKENNKGMLYGIDPWSNEASLECMKDEANAAWWGTLDMEQIFAHACDNIKNFKVEPFCTLIRDKAENVVDKFIDGSVDLLHIDGNHSEELSYKDAVLYLPKVRVGGHILFDDIWWMEHNEVTTRKAILHLLETCSKIDIVSDCMILKKES